MMENGTQNTQVTKVDTNTKIILYTILLVLSLAGNVLVIAVVLANTKLKTRFNYLIVNMAVSDLSVSLISIPLMIAEEVLKNKWLVYGGFGNALCKLSYFITDVSPGVSILSLVVIAANRFLATVYPLRLQSGSMTSIKRTIASTWIVAMIIFSPRLYTYKVLNIGGYAMCISSWQPAFDPLVSLRVFYSIVVISLFIIPFVTIIALYSIMLYKIHIMSKGIENMLALDSKQTRIRERRNRQMFYISVIAILCFALLWGPYFCFLFVWSFIWQFQVPDQVLLQLQTISFVILYLGFFNSAINPLMYFLLLKTYRRGFKRLFRFGKGRDTASELVTMRRLNTRSSFVSDHSLSHLTAMQDTRV